MAPLPFLDWPTDLFAEAHASGARMVSQVPPRVSIMKCACGCNQSHNRAVSRVTGEADARRVLWFRSIACCNEKMGIGAGVTV